MQTDNDMENNRGVFININNNLYLTNIATHNMDFVDSKTKELSTYANDCKMLWADEVSYNKDNCMYIGVSQIYLGTPFNNGEDKTTKPFYVFRFKPRIKGISDI